MPDTQARGRSSEDPHGMEFAIDDAVWEEQRARLEKYRGKYVVIAFGRVQGAFDSLEQVAEFLRSLRPRPPRAIVVRPGIDSDGGVGEWLGGSLERV